MLLWARNASQPGEVAGRSSAVYFGMGMLDNNIHDREQLLQRKSGCNGYDFKSISNQYVCAAATPACTLAASHTADFVRGNVLHRLLNVVLHLLIFSARLLMHDIRMRPHRTSFEARLLQPEMKRNCSHVRASRNEGTTRMRY